MCFSLSKKRQDTAAVPIESKKQGFSKIKGYYASGLGICAGCEEQIGWMIEEWKSKRALSATPTSPISPTSPTFVANSKVFHTSFNELAECANTCSSCRVFRQALLLRQPSIADERSLSEGQQAPIKAVLISNYTSNDLASSPELMIKISVNDSEEYSRNAYVACVRSGKFDYLGLEQSTDGVHRKLKQWLDQCQTHHRCDQLDSSPKSPTRLIRILDKSKIQLVRGDDYPQRLSYMILSYCWGGIDTGITTTKNISQRLQFVNTAELPTTIQDAIEMARLANVEYVWIDQLCIIQDDTVDWESESIRMAEYYGNALFTLCAGSNARANERLFRERAAWKWRQLQCEIHGQKLINFDTTLDQARVSSPLSSRGWTLQEEFLSPRVLYWFSQNVYWSCAEMQCSEDISPNTNRPLLPDVLIEQRPRQPNVFLSACFEGTDREKLHTEWLTIVESYSRRNLTMASDIFQAISGVAIRYYQVAHKNDRYIAGLWILTFAKELVWKAETAGDHRLDTSKELHSLAPSFSWASLPIEVHVDFQHDFTPSEFFQVAQLRDVRPNKPKEAANDHVKRGSEVKSMQVVGRLTSFWTSYSQVISWSRIDRSSNGVEKLSFAVSRDKDAHAANLENGRLAVYQDHVKEIVAQLDYVEDADRIEKGSLRLLCFEVGRSSLLLLEHLSGDTYRRAGVCYTDRDLFEGVTPKEIKLI